MLFNIFWYNISVGDILKKNEIYEVDVLDNGMSLEGICKIEGKTVFVPGLIKGEKAEIKILKVNNSYAFGKIERIISESKSRCLPECKEYAKCGGCDGLHITYEKSLDIKRENAINTLKKQNVSIDFSLTEVYGMSNPYNYRNKAQYPVRDVKGELMLGMFSKGTHNLVNAKNCKLQDNRLNEIADLVYDELKRSGLRGYNEEEGTGVVRNILLRRGKHTEQVMLVFVVNGKEYVSDKRLSKVISNVCGKASDIQTVCVNVNDKNTNVILTDETYTVFGSGYITDYVGDKVFKIGANSFFQVNTIQAEVLYNVLKEKLKLVGNESVLDLYSGVGSIGIFLSDSVSKVYGVEIVPEAVQMAKENIKLNNITNAQYIQGDATDEIAKLERCGVKFDTVVVDPPRKGLDTAGIETLKKIQAKKIGYVSCNTATLARDLKLLEDRYNVVSIDFVDLFPFTRTFGVCSGAGVKIIIRSFER